MAGKVLITGASGLLGREVVQEFSAAGWDVTGTAFSRAHPPIHKIDLTDETAVSDLLNNVQPQVVIHCAANRFPDKCDVDPEGARALNVEATASLVRNTVARNIFIVYISTDYVFPGKEGDAPYEVDACTAPPNLYGQTKLDGENAVLEQAGVKHLGVVLRVPVLYGQANYPKESAVNALQESVWRAQERDIRIEMDDWALRYPTNTEDVGRVCKDLAVKYLGSSESQRESFPTVLHFSSEDRFTKYEICQLMAEILGLPLIGMTANKTGNAPHGIQRPYDSHLSSSELEKLGIPIWTQDFKAWWRREFDAVRH